jgi:hypothetical protein
MTPEQVQKVFIENHINEKACQLFPDHVQEGALCLIKEDDTWIVLANERGNWILQEKFWIESDACKFFLTKVLSDPTNRNDFKQSDLEDWENKKINLLRKYNLL